MRTAESWAWIVTAALGFTILTIAGLIVCGVYPDFFVLIMTFVAPAFALSCGWLCVEVTS